VLCSTVPRGSRHGRLIALTFDDGPGLETAAILDILKQHNARATFFLCGANAAAHPELVRRIETEGHGIGNHAQSHRRFLGKSADWIRQEIASADATLLEVLGPQRTPYGGKGTRLFRPPYGLRWVGLAGILQELNLRAIMWDVNSHDWENAPEEIVARVVQQTQPGSIVLLHDGVPPNESTHRRNTVAALPEIIRQLSPHYQFCTVYELLEAMANQTGEKV
jgi:peptidoglycan/xylan/chitin deacetylase (PgdA/CDA1 family)